MPDIDDNDRLEKQLNGFGERLNLLSLDEAACKSESNQRLKSLEEAYKNQRYDIKEIFVSLERQREITTSLKGRIIGAATALAFLIPLITSILQEYVLKK